MQMTPSNADEGWAYAHGMAAALNWADHRCECGAGRWAVFTRDWLMCDVCEMAIGVREIAQSDAIDPDRPVTLLAVKLPMLGGAG